MRVALLDVNFLVAIFDPAHLRFEAAHRWLERHRRTGWATCAITENGCIRILSDVRYPVFRVSPADMTSRVRDLCADPHHHFWPDSVSLTDATLFNHAAIRGHKQITDVYLLGLAVRNGGRLATFDSSIPLDAVHGATPDHLVAL